MQSRDGIPHQIMGCSPISWTHVLSNLKTRGPIYRAYQQQNKNVNTSIMQVGDNILVTTAEEGINESWCLLYNQSIWNAFINGKYLSNIIDAPNGQYLRVNCNTGVTHTKKSGNLPGYSDPVWYNPKGIANIPSLDLVQKNHIVTYNSQYVNEFDIHIPQQATFNIIKGWSIISWYESPPVEQICIHCGERLAFPHNTSAGQEERIHHPQHKKLGLCKAIPENHWSTNKVNPSFIR